MCALAKADVPSASSLRMRLGSRLVVEELLLAPIAVLVLADAQAPKPGSETRAPGGTRGPEASRPLDECDEDEAQADVPEPHTSTLTPPPPVESAATRTCTLYCPFYEWAYWFK